MLEITRPFGAPVKPYLSSHVTCGVASEAWQLRAYWALRREVFCEETGLFASSLSERDSEDAHAWPLVALSHCAGAPEEVVGVVRIYRARGDTWYGGRLAVARAYRARGAVGAALIHMAVSTAITQGCERFVATVLASNGPYFRRHGFRAVDTLELCGRPHLLMEAELSAFGSVRRTG